MDDKTTAKKIITLPNILSLFRLMLIPLFCVVYVRHNNYELAAVVLFVSGLSDVVDGFVARRFNMVSDVGKVLDPIADKLTQLAVLGCLISRFRKMIIPCVLLGAKELATGVAGLIAVKKTGIVCSAEWHGKLTTLLLYTMMAMHILWHNIPQAASELAIGLCVAVMLLSFVLYSVRNLRMIAGKYVHK